MNWNIKRAVVVPMLCAAVMLAVGLPAQGGLLVVDYGAGNGNLYDVSTVDASATLIGDTGLETIGSLEHGLDGLLYAITTGTYSKLYTINQTTAEATLIGALDIGFVFEGSITFARDGRAYATNSGNSSNPELFTVDLLTGTATLVAQMSDGSHDINGMVMRSDGLLVGLDRVTNALLTIDPGTAATASIAALSPTVGDAGGMTTSDGVNGYFAVSGSGELYTVNLYTGIHSLVGGLTGDISPGQIGGVAVPEPATLALLGLGGIGLLRKRKHA